jgi:transposase
MDAREQRGILIAAMTGIDRQNGAWLVPSQTTPDRKYAVKLDGQGSCTCPDHIEAGFTCKHIRAVRIVLKRELGMDGAITETRSITFEEKKTYSQDWPAYNRPQACEKHRLQVLLHDLCRELEDPPHGHGRKPHNVRDSIFAMVLKVYGTMSGRRSSCDLKDTFERGHTSKPIPGLKVNTMMEQERFTPILRELIAKSAAPLKAVERDFAVDSSGFSSSKFHRWYDEKYGAMRQKSIWVKAHIMCGIKTNVIAAVRILDWDAADSPQFKPLVNAAAETFTVNEVSADKAYASQENFEAVAEVGGTGFLAFKSNHTGEIGGLFAKMLGYFQFRKEEFLRHYHKRSNVESTFSMVKRKFGDSVRSKSDVAMVNEVLCKFICHNLCCLIQSQMELGIDPVFWQDEPSDPAILPMNRNGTI